MDPNRLEDQAKREDSKASNDFKAADTAKNDVKRLRAKVDELRRVAEINIQAANTEADNAERAGREPHEVQQWHDRAVYEQTKLDQAVSKLESDAQAKEREAERLESEANREHQRAQELMERKRKLQAVILLSQNTPEEDLRNAA